MQNAVTFKKSVRLLSAILALILMFADVVRLTPVAFADDGETDISYEIYEDELGDEPVEEEEYDTSDSAEDSTPWNGRATVRGTVINIDTEQGAGGVNVVLEGGAYAFSATTAGNGTFTIDVQLHAADAEEGAEPVGLTITDWYAFLSTAQLTTSGGGMTTRRIGGVSLINGIDAEVETTVYLDVATVPGGYVPEGMRVVTGLVYFGENTQPNQDVVVNGQTVSANNNGRYIAFVPKNYYYAYIESSMTTVVPDNLNNLSGSSHAQNVTSGLVEAYLGYEDLFIQNLEMHLIGAIVTEERVPRIHHISTAAELNQFLLGTLGTNYDTFILMNDITAIGSNGSAFPAGFAPTGGTSGNLQNHHVGRPTVGNEPFTGIFMGDPGFMSENNGRAPQIIGLRLRPRRNANHTFETPTNAQPSNSLGLNDYGFIRLLGDGAVIQNVTFLNTRFYDGGTGATGGARGSGNTTIAYTGTSTTNTNALLAQRAGGHGPQANHSHQGNGGNVGLNLPTHRAIVAGRVLPNATVSISNVNIGNPITAALNDDDRVTATGYAVNMISTSRHHGIWNARMGGMIGAIAPGATVNVSDSDVSIRLFQQALGSWNQAGGLVATNEGRLNVNNVNIASEMTESHWGHNHHNGTMYAGGLVARNTGTINFIGNGQRNNHIHMITIREGQTAGFNNGSGGGTSNTSGRNWGHFNHVGRITAFSSGPVNVRNVDLTGNIFGLRDVAGAIGATTAPVTLDNLTISGNVGGARNTFDTTVLPRETRAQNSGGIVGRATSLVNINNTTVNSNVFGSRGTNVTTQSTGGFIGNAQSVIINNSTFFSGNLNDVGGDGTGGGHGGNMGGFIGRATGAVSISNSEVRGGTMQNGGTHARNRPNGRGGMVGLGTATSTIIIDNAVNRMNVNTSRGYAGGFVGRMMGRNITINNATNHGTVTIHGLATGWGFDTHRAAGGHIGRTDNSNILITNSYNRGLVNGSVRRRGLGGFVGTTFGASNTVTLNNVHNYGNITRGNHTRGNAGGLLGWMRGNVIITDSTNRGVVSVIATGTSTGGGANENMMGGLVSRVDRTLTITNSTNYANVTNAQNRPNRMGGIVGYARGRTTLTDVTNHGNVTSDVSTAGRRNHVTSNLGGIMGRSDMGGAGTAQRQTIFTNVENHGHVGTGAGVTTAMHTAGGIIGRTMNRGSNSYALTNVVNNGNVRARNYAGGIIGFNDSPNVRIEDAANHGNVNSFWGNSDARGHIGGIVGRTGRATLNINRSFNTGEIRTLSTSGHAGTTTASAGGLVGHRSAGQVNINESFNAGTVMGVYRNTGGLVGLSRGSGGLTIRNAYNIGTVTSRISGSGAALTRRQRSGNGILGFRGGGPVLIENVYNAGRVQGRPIYGVPASAPNGAIGSYMTFRNVFFDTSVHTGIAQTISRGTISGVPTDLLNRGILPGISGSQWLTGLNIPGDDLPYLNTYPYLAWQTNGVRENQFMTSVREASTGYSFSDLDGTGSRTGEFVVPADYVGRTKYFAPYASTQAVHFAPTTGETSTTTLTETGPRSLGLVSENWVVGFDIEDRTGVAVMAVDEITGEAIYWAEFNADTEISTPIAGVFIVSNVPSQGIHVDITALGYEDTTRLITIEEYELDPTGVIRIPMRRVDIPHVRVEVRNETGTDENPISNITPDSTLRHERLAPNAFGPNNQTAQLTPAPRHFMLDNLQWHDILHANAPNFSNTPHALGIEHFYHIAENPSASNPHIVHVYVEDLRLPNRILNVVWFEDFEGTDDAQEESPRRVNINRTGTTNAPSIIGAHVTPVVRQPDGITASPATSVNSTSVAAHQWNIVNPLTETQIQVGAAGFRTSEFLTIGELLEYSEPSDANPDAEATQLNTITIDLERLIRLNVTAVRSVSFNDDGVMISGPAPTTQVQLEFTDGLGAAGFPDRTLTRNTSNTFTVTGVSGEELRATAVGYDVAFHVIDFLEDVTTRHSTANNFTGSLGNIVMVLTPLEEIERIVVFDYYPDASYGTVEARIDGELINNTISDLPVINLNGLDGFTLDITENKGEFSHWQSPSFPGEEFTTEELMALTLPDGISTWTAVFAEPLPPLPVTYHSIGQGEISATLDGDVHNSTDEIPAGSTVVFTATPETGYEILEWRVNNYTVVVDDEGVAELVYIEAESLEDVLEAMEKAPNLTEWLNALENTSTEPVSPGQPTVALNGNVLTVSDIFIDTYVTVEFTPIVLEYTFDFGEGFNTYATDGTTGYNGTPVAPEAIPINVGYRFDGWEPAVGPITQNTDFSAIWTPTQVDFAFDWDWDDEIIERTEGYNYLPIAPSFDLAPHRAGMHVVAWEPTMHRITDYENVTVFTAVWADNDEIGVTFNPNGGEFASDEDGIRVFPYGLTVNDHEDGMPEIQMPPAGGYTFGGWFIDGDDSRPFDGDDVVNDSMTVIAAWMPIYVDYTFDFNPDDEYTFVTGSGSSFEEGTIRYAGTPVAPTTIPINVGYRFTGWDPTVGPITVDTDFVAVWEEETVDYEFYWVVTSDDIDLIHPGTLPFNDIPTPPTEVPNNPGYHHSGWLIENDPTRPFVPGQTRLNDHENITRIYAQWTLNGIVRVNFEPGIGTLQGASFRELPDGAALAEQMPLDPTPPSGAYSFRGWFIDGDDVPANLLTAQTYIQGPGPVYVVALWDEVFVDYNFNFDPNNNITFAYEDAAYFNTEGSVRYHTAPSAPTNIPINVGYRFDGWTPAVGPITENTTFNAVWVRETVSYRFDWAFGGLYEDGEGLDYNDFATPPTEVPTRPGYTFTSFSPDPETTRVNNITQRTVFTAQWEENEAVEVTFDLAGGVIDASTVDVVRTILSGQTVGTNMPVNPTREGYDFGGWFIDGNQSQPFTGETTVLTDTQVVAYWTDIVRTPTLTANNVRVRQNDVNGDIYQWLFNRANVSATTTVERVGIAPETIAHTAEDLEITFTDLGGDEVDFNTGLPGQYIAVITLPTSTTGAAEDLTIEIIITLVRNR